MVRSTESRIAAILLAAGAASRFGSPKQLALIDGIALVRRSAIAILDTGLPLTVVTGAHAGPVVAALDGLPLQLLHNPAWQQGMGTSIACAVEHLRADTGLDGALVCLGDQPKIGAEQLRRLLDAHEQRPGGITAADHGAVVGPPCVFARRYFDALAGLHGHEGARGLLVSHAIQVHAVPMPEAGIDIDTVEQYLDLQARQRS